MTVPHSRIYLITPEDGDNTHLQRVLLALVNSGDVGALLIRAQSEDELRSRANALTKIAHEHDIAVLIDEDARCARETDADGVHVTGNTEVLNATRDVVGKDMIIGVDPGLSRHEAMEIAETGADYIAFKDIEMAQWWAPLFEVPCVSLPPASYEEAGALAEHGVEFICPDMAIWDSPEKAAEMTKRYLEIFARTSI